MASLILSYNPVTAQLDWTISGLSATFISSNYLQAGICTSEVSSGQTAGPYGVIQYVTAKGAFLGENYYVSGTVDLSGWEDATFTIYGFTQIKSNWTYYPVGPVTISLIKHWSWSKSNGKASAAQTQAAYNAITGKGKTSNFSHLVWNDLCKKVYVAAAAGAGWWVDCGVNGSATPGYEATKMSDLDKTLTAARFNAVRGNIAGRYGTAGIDANLPGGIPIVSTGATVYGLYFDVLTKALNTWISNITS